MFIAAANCDIILWWL